VGSQPSDRYGSPQAYTPKHLAEKIINSKTALEGERKQVTVLFADLKGSMELLANRDPEEAQSLLDPVLAHMMEAVHHYEGTVNQVMGDGIMALFGAPLAHEDHAVRGCYAALRMQDSVKRYAEEVRRAEGIPIQIRVGLNSGEVVVRSIGSDLHMDYSAVGQTTHLAARMEQMATPGSILITASTLNVAEGYVEVNPLGPLPIKGLGAPVEVYELTGPGPARSRLHAAAARGLTPFVGRKGELDELRLALERAEAGHGNVVGVVGEPGVGKSRLYWELARAPRLQGWLILESSCVSYGKATGYLPITDLLKIYFKIEARDGTRTIHEKVTGKLLSLDRQLEPWLPALLSLLDVPVDDVQWERLDPPQRRQRTIEGVKRVLLRESQVQPLLVVCENLQWIDGETQAVLGSLVESLPTARMLLAVNYRPEYQHDWASKTYFRQLRIDPLPSESADDLLRSLLGSDTSIEPLKQALIKQTEGNPLFLEESVRMLVETKALIGERAAYRLAQDVRNVHVPATVQAILAARIDRLSPADKRLLQAASVIGKDVPFGLLDALGELSENGLRQGLAGLQTAEFLREARLFPDLEYTFKHTLTHEVAYGSVLEADRSALHARILAAIETRYADRLVDKVDRLAHHAFRGKVWDKAVIYLRQAGARALARSANREAVARFEQALAALGHLPETRQTLEEAIDLRFDLRLAFFLLGDLEASLRHLREAEHRAATLGDRRRLGWASAYMGNHHWLTGHVAEARAFDERAQMIAVELGDFSLRIVADYFLSLAYLTSGDYRRAEASFLSIIRSLEGDLARERFGLAGFPVVICRCWLAWCLAERGQFEGAIAYGREAIRLAETLDHRFSMAWSHWGLAYVYLVKGDMDDAANMLDRSRALSVEEGQLVWPQLHAWSFGRLRALSGQVAEGIALLQQSLQIFDATRLGIWQSLVLVHLSEACVLAGRLAEARDFGERGLTLARERTERSHEAWALRLLADIDGRADDLAAGAAERRYRDAMTLAEQLDMRPLVAHCHLGLGKLSRRAGKREQAQAHLATATTLYREMGMTYWLEKAQAEIAKPER